MEYVLRSPYRIIQSDVGVKAWLLRVPTTEGVRPARCVACGVASRPAGGGLRLWGHGLRTRQVRGPLSVDGVAQEVEILARRYLCRACGAAMLVVPREVTYRALFTTSAIALALALWSIEGLSPAEVRRRVSPWQTVGFSAYGQWASLRRWTRAAQRLWPGLRRAPPSWSARQVAQRITTALAAHAPRADGGLLERVFVGAAHAVRSQTDP